MSENQWQNPLFRSKSSSTICSSKLANFPTLADPSNLPSEKDMKRLIGCVSEGWRMINGMPSASSFATRDKEVVIEGYVPTTEQSLINFLKGMGLKPKIDLVGRETVITADVSKISDAALKHRFIKFMKKQVVNASQPTLIEASSSSVASPALVTSSTGELSAGTSTESSITLESSEHKSDLSNKEKLSITAQQENSCTKAEDKKKQKSVGFKTVGMVSAIDNRSENHGMTNACVLTRQQYILDQPSCSAQQEIATECQESVKKKKKLRIVKHLRKWFCKSKDTKPLVEVSKDSNNNGLACLNKLCSKETHDFIPVCQTVRVAPDVEHVPVIATLHTDNNVGGQSSGKTQHEGISNSAKLFVQRHESWKENHEYKLKPKKKIKIHSKAFDGSISLPVLITPDQSCFKNKNLSSNIWKASKSSTMTTENSLVQNSYSVVGDKAAIHISKNRIQLEGKDIKYGSILQTDKDFDKHFCALKENSTSDIEKHVKKVKERIMFARAMGAVGDRLPEGAPKVDFKKLLMPEKRKQENRSLDYQRHIEVATTTSFYQKFLASMNILKTTYRFDACDRSVMTDEPLSKTYAEFIKIENGESKLLANSSSVPGPAHLIERVTSGDSSVNLPVTSYLKMICTCWEPLLKCIPDDNDVRRSQKTQKQRRRIS